MFTKKPQPTGFDMDINSARRISIDIIRKSVFLIFILFLVFLGLGLAWRAVILQTGGTTLAQGPPFVTQEIRYHTPEASEVFLVWGINGWNVVPEENRPAGTVVKNDVMHTPMVREGGTFVA
jgi:hypothetical protein